MFYIKLENAAIAMHCNLRTPVLIRLNYDAHAKFEVAQPICCHLIAFYCCDLDNDFTSQNKRVGYDRIIVIKL